MSNKLNKRFFRMVDDRYADFMQAAELEGRKGTDVARELLDNYSKKIFLKHEFKPLSYAKWKRLREKIKSRV